MKPVVALLRQVGIRLIIYLDDILIMASSKDLLLFHVHAATTLNIVESLGFIINYLKISLNPLKLRQLEFLGHLVDSENLCLGLSWREITKDQEKMPQPFSLPGNLNRRVVKIPGPPDLLNSGSFSCSSPF